MTGGWESAAADGMVRCRALHAIPGLVHGFATRAGNADFGPPGGADCAQRELRVRFAHALGVPGADFAEARQVHADRVIVAAEALPETEADAVVVSARTPSVLAAVRTADCAPVLLASHRWAAAVHAGWRGIVAGICIRAVEQLAERGEDPGGLVAAVGPAIGPCCYRVGPDCAAAVAGAAPGGPVWIVRGAEIYADLPEACRRQLVAAGIRPENVHRAPWCTACRTDRFHSYRREADRAGRALSAIGFRPPAELGRA